jgi:hypothetical protein
VKQPENRQGYFLGTDFLHLRSRPLLLKASGTEIS